MDRREFLFRSACGLGALYLGGLRHAFARPVASFNAKLDFDAGHPWVKVEGPFDGTKFSGDEHRRPHDILWHLEQYIAGKGGRPSSIAESVDVLIVGGGTAGLLSAYRFRHHNFLVVEQASQFGGNARSEEYRGAAYSLGPAYVTIPDAGSELEKFYQELNLRAEAREEAPDKTRVLFGALKNLREEPGAAGESARAWEELLSRLLPNLPSLPPLSAEKEKSDALDSLTAESWLKAQGPWHPLVMEQLQLYAWSSFGGSLDEISAAQFLNFVASETRGVMAFSGGNGAITRRLYERLKEKGEHRLRAGTMVLEIKEEGGYVEVLLEDAGGSLRRIRASALVMAAPKYVARFLLKAMLPAPREAVWRELPYRAYAVANILLKEKVEAPAFDIYCLKGTVPPSPSFGRRTDRPVADFVFANWAAPDAEGPTVLTAYRPFPLDGARNFLLNPMLHDRLKAEFKADMEQNLKAMGIGPDQIAGIRIALWGHSLPLARPGYLSSAALADLGGRVGERVFLANQDNFMNPSFEACFEAAKLSWEEVCAKKLLPLG
ncbi:MAG: FAD-binding protein [Proteobacteria bacterium]|nr:MAG: FAD-binding protein [Pseudomonadota bacterium]